MNNDSQYNAGSPQKLPVYPHSAGNRLEDDDEEELDELEEDHEAEVGYGNAYRSETDDDEEDFESLPKKRKLKNLTDEYEFVPPAVARGGIKFPNLVTEWSDHSTFLLLEAWGNIFLKLGRNSLRSDDWHEVAEMVSEESKVERTAQQCRNRLEALKKKYKREKEKAGQIGLNSNKWVFFKKMEMLMESPRRQGRRLACGVDSGEYVFMDSRVYLDRSNGLNEMRDSPGESEESEYDDDSDGLPPPPARPILRGDGGEDDSSYRLLANSIQKFEEIHEKIESTKRHHMVELKKMRMDFHRELELQKKQILERAKAEISNIRHGNDEETDSSSN